MDAVDLKNLIQEKAKEVLPYAREIRHKIHSNPELTWEERETSLLIADELDKIPNITVIKGIAKYGVIGELKGDHSGPVIALRADMDALPILDQTNASYRSKNDGKSHSCGHDGHMANLLGTVKVLSQLKSYLKGTIKFIFQPAEEGGAGAKVLCEEGALDNPKVDVIFGLHAWSTLAKGKIFVKKGPVLAANTEVRIEVSGAGGHAAFPHLSTDQILVASRIYDSLQSIVSRSVEPGDQVVFTVGKFQGGTKSNIIPDKVYMEGTLRTLSKESRDSLLKLMEKMAKDIATAHGACCKFEFNHLYPPTINHDKPTENIKKIISEAIGSENVKELKYSSMGAEDFSFYLERIPGSFFLLGMDDGREGGYPSLHHPGFNFNDESLETSITAFASIALNYYKYL